jgi:hypothetical protein
MNKFLSPDRWGVDCLWVVGHMVLALSSWGADTAATAGQAFMLDRLARDWKVDVLNEKRSLEAALDQAVRRSSWSSYDERDAMESKPYC